MNLNNRKFSLIGLLLIFLISCEEGPTITKIPKDENNVHSKDYNHKELFNKEKSNVRHTVVVNEILPTKKYTYLQVTEGNDKFWVATRKKDVQVGQIYSFINGLLKTNYESKEYNRNFDKVYLVNNLEIVGSAVSSSHEEHIKVEESTIANTGLIEREGSMKISELLSDPKKYEGQTIQVTGKCVKINPNIMKRNWIHIQDGSRNDYDLLITSDVFVAEDDTFTMKAVVVLNKDFGAGYKYEVLLEDGILIK